MVWSANGRATVNCLFYPVKLLDGEISFGAVDI